MARLKKRQSGFIPLIMLVVVGAGLSGATAVASQKSIPGDALYPVKKATENIRVATAFSQIDKAKVYLSIAEEKVKEIEKLEKSGKIDKIAETTQGLESSQGEALELTESAKSKGENVDELVALLEINMGRQKIVLSGISAKVSEQAREAIKKSLEQLNTNLKITEAIKEDEQEELDTGPTPCPSPTSQAENNDGQNYQEEENYEDEQEYWNYKNQDVQGISQLRNSKNSQYGSNPCDSTERTSGAGSSTFDGGSGSFDEGDFGGSDQGSPNGEPAEAPTSPGVKGVSTGGLLQFILNALFHSQKR